MAIGHALGMDEWRERAYINWLRKGRKEVLDKLMASSAKQMENDRKFIEENRKHTFNEVLVGKPWDVINMKLLSKKNSAMQILHDTWLPLMREAPKYCQDVYDNSPLQKGLEEFINKNLSQYVYKRK